MSKKPLIGVTTSVSKNESFGITTLAAYDRNVVALERAGAIPVLIPCNLSEDTLRGLYERLDGILLPGGGDIHSDWWGEPLHPTANTLDPLRDATEVRLARWAVADDRPVFGICRGHQIFNVALGAALIQDIATEYSTEQKHDYFHPNPRNLRAHEIRLTPESRLAQIIGQTRIEVNSLHHQAVRRAADGLTVTALSPDGIIEATEIPDKRFALTVQWHPEDLAGEDDRMFNLFRAFVSAAATD